MGGPNYFLRMSVLILLAVLFVHIPITRIDCTKSSTRAERGKGINVLASISHGIPKGSVRLR